MADDLQALLDRIHQEGVDQAEAERKQIIDAAEKDATAIRQEARGEADRIVSEAKQEAELLSQKGRESLRQAARDVLLSLRERLRERATAVAGACAGKALDADMIATLVRDVMHSELLADGSVERVEVQVDETQMDALRQGLLAALGDDLRERCDLAPLPEGQAGFRLRFNGQDVEYDFTAAALAETLAEFVNPRLAELIPADFDATGEAG